MPALLRRRRLIAVDVLLVDDFALQTHDATQTTEFYEIAVERHLKSATVIASNRTPAQPVPVAVEWLAGGPGRVATAWSHQASERHPSRWRDVRADRANYQTAEPSRV